MCHHVTPCPDATSEARDLAAVVSSHPEQGWSPERCKLLARECLASLVEWLDEGR